MSKVVLDIARLVERDGREESEHVECVVLETLIVAEIVRSLRSSSFASFAVTGKPMRELADALEGAMR